MVVVLLAMVLCAAVGGVVTGCLAAYAQRHWKRRPGDDPPGGGTQRDHDLAG